MSLSAACGGGSEQSAPPPPVRHGEVTVDGQVRRYRVFVPPTLDRRGPVPLVLVLHGGASSVEDTVKTTLFDREASTGEFIVAYPEGTRREWLRPTA